jgi:hypothetical protein
MPTLERGKDTVLRMGKPVISENIESPIVNLILILAPENFSLIRNTKVLDGKILNRNKWIPPLGVNVHATLQQGKE